MKRLINSSNIRSRIIICGGRHFTNYSCLDTVVDQVLLDLDLDFDEIEIVSGHCSGADQLGETYAETNGISYSTFPAQWSIYGKAAGPIRNSEMIKYASDSEIPVVIAFISPNTRGTNDTVSKAKKLGFKVYVTEYDNIEASVSIFGGIRLSDDDNYIFDFDNDEDGDIVKLSKQHINMTKMGSNIRYFGYKVERDVEDAIRKEFLSWVKTPEGYSNPGVVEMIDRCVEEFAENNSDKYDYIISTASSSELTSILSQKISAAFDNTPIIDTSKLDVSNLQLNKELATTELKKSGKSDEYIKKLLDFIQQRYIEPQLKSGYFSIRKVSPRYRKWLTPMFKFSDINDIKSANRILIVDENLTTGETVNQIIALLKSSKYSGAIDIFTLLSNR